MCPAPNVNLLWEDPGVQSTTSVCNKHNSSGSSLRALNYTVLWEGSLLGMRPGFERVVDGANPRHSLSAGTEGRIEDDDLTCQDLRSWRVNRVVCHGHAPICYHKYRDS